MGIIYRNRKGRSGLGCYRAQFSLCDWDYQAEISSKKLEMCVSRVLTLERREMEVNWNPRKGDIFKGRVQDQGQSVATLPLRTGSLVFYIFFH